MTKSEEPNSTVKKFGFPQALVAEYRHWLVLVRPRQATLGALILAHKGPATSFSAIESAAFTELARVTGDIERTLEATVGFDKLNYLMLMMVDPHVHFHVLPRYATTKTFNGTIFPDPGWPGAPDLAAAAAADPATLAALRARLEANWTPSA